MSEKVTFWLCSKEHQHVSPKEADLCDNPLRGDEKVQWQYFEIGEKFIRFPEDAFSFMDEELAKTPDNLEIWEVTRIETREASSRPGPGYLFERAFYTLVSNCGNEVTLSGRDLRLCGTRIKNVRKALLAYLRATKRDLSRYAKEVDEIVEEVKACVDSFPYYPD